jgi:NAD(P)-dependent dehydrogenase (short-subunit alcohol dehydrogenase family)
LERTAGELSGSGHRVIWQAADMADEVQLSQLVDRFVNDWGRIDALIHVAGVNRRMPVEQVSMADYDFVVDTNLRGAFYLAQLVGRTMLARGAGTQIHIASLNSDRPLKNVVPYAISKAGLAQMVRALALEWGPRGIRVNAISPGFILTDLTRQLWSHPDMQAWGERNTPLRRLGQPDDLVGAEVFLASAAARFMTGQVLYVDGGFTAGWNWPIP